MPWAGRTIPISSKPRPRSALACSLFFGALAWSGAWTTDGSVLAARLRDRLPNFFWILPAAAFWYATAEAIEPHHVPASPLLVLLVLAAAAWVVLRLARGIVSALARAAIAILRAAFSPRAPSWSRRPHLQPIRRRAAPGIPALCPSSSGRDRSLRLSAQRSLHTQ